MTYNEEQEELRDLRRREQEIGRRAKKRVSVIKLPKSSLKIDEHEARINELPARNRNEKSFYI